MKKIHDKKEIPADCEPANPSTSSVPINEQSNHGQNFQYVDVEFSPSNESLYDDAQVIGTIPDENYEQAYQISNQILLSSQPNNIKKTPTNDGNHNFILHKNISSFFQLFNIKQLLRSS